MVNASLAVAPSSTIATARRGSSPGNIRRRFSVNNNNALVALRRKRPAAAAPSSTARTNATVTNGTAAASCSVSFTLRRGSCPSASSTARALASSLNDDPRRRFVGAAAAGGGGAGAEDDSAAAAEGDELDPVVDNVERAAKLLDTIIQETLEQIFVEEAVEEVIPGDGDGDGDDDDEDGKNNEEVERKPVDKEEVLRGVVLKHLEEFDGSFMAAISAYVQVAESSGDFGLLNLLAAIREEVLAAVSGEMQPDIQVVQLVARLASKEDRLEVLRAAHRGGGKAAGFDVPAAPIEKVENCSARLIDEMELQEHVPNWQLLWQLLLVRETSRQLHPNADDMGVYGTTIISSSFSPSEIPKAEAALIKELCVVNEPLARRANIMDKFEQCRELDEYREADGGKIKLKRTARGFTPRKEDLGGNRGGDDGGMDVFDVRDIRPGRFIDCVINMRVALQREQADRRIIDRLSAMYYEACDVVLEQADKGVKKSQAEDRSRNELSD